MNVTFPALAAAESLADDCHNGRGLRTVLWCTASLEWLLPVLCVVFAVALKLGLYVKERREQQAKSEKEVKQAGRKEHERAMGKQYSLFLLHDQNC